MDNKFDLDGQTFGRLTVLERAPNMRHLVHGRYPQFHRAWKVLCACGTEKIIKGAELRRGHALSCGCWRREQASKMASRRGPEHAGWKGGRSKQPTGYIRLSRVTLVDGTEATQIFEHRHVMETALGRRLLPGENVHHKNGKRDDNRPANLELWVEGQPSGHRTKDAVAYAKEILRRYEPRALAGKV